MGSMLMEKTGGDVHLTRILLEQYNFNKTPPPPTRRSERPPTYNRSASCPSEGAFQYASLLGDLKAAY